MCLKNNSKYKKIVVCVLKHVLLFGNLIGAFYFGQKGFDELAERKAGVYFYKQLAKNNKVKTSEKLLDYTIMSKSEIDFDALREICPDIVGWLRIESTAIDYPIVQAKNNNFYLHHLPDQTPNSTGSIMMNCTNDSAFNNDVTILHGHHMRNGAMFSSLESYNNEDYYLKHPTIHLFTPTGDYDVAVFAAYTVNGYSFSYATSFEDKTDFETFIRKAVSSTKYKTDIGVEFGDRLLLLSTCAYSFEGARYLVVGKIIE